MKRLIAGILAALLLLSLSSYNSGTHELQDELIVEGIGIDVKDNAVIVTVLALNTEENPAGEGTSSSGKITANYRMSGKTIDDALAQLALQTGKEPVYSHNRIIIIGKSVYTGKGIDSMIDYFVRSYQPRANVLIAAAENAAEEILGADAGEGKNPAKIMQDMIQSGKENGQCSHIYLYEYLNRSESPGLCGYLPILTLEKGENEKEQQILARGTLVTKDGKEVLSLSKEETETLMYLNEKLTNGTLSGKAGGTDYSLDIIESRPRMEMTLSGGKPLLTVHLTCTGDITEFDRNTAGTSRQDVTLIAREAQTALESAVRSLLEKTVKENGYDLYGLNARLKKSETAFYKAQVDAKNDEKTQANWQEILQDMPIAYDIRIRVRRLGQDIIQT